MAGTKRLSLHGRLRMAAACPDPNASLLAEAADAIEQHEAFRQEVSDAVEWLVNSTYMPAPSEHKLRRFIIAKPDPLVEALDEALWEVSNVKLTDRELRAVSLRLNAKRGGEIEGEKQ